MSEEPRDRSHGTSSEIFCCGPSHKPEQVNKNQFLSVKRSTTDPEALCAVILYMIFMVLVFLFAWDKGNHYLLLHGMDYRGKTCGVGDLATYSKQAWTNPLVSNIHASAICVKDCPAPTTASEQIDKGSVFCLCNRAMWPNYFDSSSTEYKIQLSTDCDDSSAIRLGYFTKSIPLSSPLHALTKTGASGGVDQPCSYRYRTKWAMHRCVPWMSPNATAMVVDQTGATHTQEKDYVSAYLKGAHQVMEGMMSDVSTAMPIIGSASFLALVLAIVAMVALQYCAEFISKGIMLLLLLIFIGCALVTWQEYAKFSDLVDVSPAPATREQDTQNMYIYLALFVLSCLSTVTHLFMSIYLYDDIETAISIIRVASRTFTDAPQLLVYPMVHVAFFLFFISWWFVGALLLYTSGDIKTANNGVASLDHTPVLRSAALFYAFGLYWLSAFINAMGYMIIAGTVYCCTFAAPLTDDNGDILEGPLAGRDVPKSVMTTSSLVMIRYHMGTCAYGALTLSVLWPVRIVVNFFTKLGKWENSFLKFVCCCFQCCVCCFDSCIKYMNQMVYLQTVLHGSPFCYSAFHGMQVVLDGLDDIGSTTYVSSFVLTVIKFSITLLCTACAAVAIQNGVIDSSDMEYAWVPYAFTAFAAYVITTGFMLLLEVAIDAIMVAYCEYKFAPIDEDTHRPAPAIKNVQLPAELLDHIERTNKKEAQRLMEDREHAAMAQPLMGGATK